MKRLALVGACTLVLAACGGGGGKGSDASQVKHVWLSFFSTKASLDSHVALLQNGERFRSVIQGFLADPLAKSVNATISKVTIESPRKAKVDYSIGVVGLSLSNQVGYAYKVNGKWLVGYQSLCALIGLEGTTPAVCKT